MADGASPLTTINHGTVARIEAVERDAWLDTYEAATSSLRTALGFAQRRVDDGVLFVCRGFDHLQFNRLGHLDITEPARTETLDAALAEFSAANVKNFVVHVAPGADRLAQLCASRGLTPHPFTLAKFIRYAAPAPTVETAIVVREIGREQKTVFGATAAQGFGFQPLMGEWLAELAGRPRWRCFIGYDGDTPVATGAVFTDKGCGWIGVGATLASHRRRGAQSALLAARIKAAIEDGCTLLSTVTGIPRSGEAAPSYANIQRAGFAIAYPRPNWRRE